MKYMFSHKGIIVLIIFLMFAFCLVGCSSTTPVEKPSDTAIPVEKPSDTTIPAEKPGDTTVPVYKQGDSGTDYLGLSVSSLTGILGNDYEIISDNSTGLYYEDINWVFYVGEIYPEGYKFTGKEIVKFIDVYDGQIIRGAYIGDSAKEIARELNIVDYKLEVDDMNGVYDLIYYTELNGYNSYVVFTFETIDGVCVHAWAKSDEL